MTKGARRGCRRQDALVGPGRRCRLRGGGQRRDEAWPSRPLTSLVARDRSVQHVARSNTIWLRARFAGKTGLPELISAALPSPRENGRYGLHIAGGTFAQPARMTIVRPNLAFGHRANSS